MSKKQDAFYFDNFVACATYALEASKLLEKVMCNFNRDDLDSHLAEMHEIEHSADRKKHALLDTLSKAFITPIDREDISSMSQTLDEITDKLEDVIIRIYYNQVRTIRPDAIELAKTVTCCCAEVCELLKEFSNFRHSKTIRDHIVKINSYEEQADKLFIKCMYDLHSSCENVLDIIAWREIYKYLEKCADAAEHTADVVETVIMKNS